MNILIIENEVYLSHSIAKSLMDIGHTCTMCVTLDDVIMDHKYDVVLLSTSINENNFKLVKEVYMNAIIILLASYISNDTNSDLHRYGAKDYILKPFMMDQLIDKIEHYISYRMLEMKCNSYEKYLSHQFMNTDYGTTDTDVKLPLFISANNQKPIDAFAYQYAKSKNIPLSFITLSDPQAMKKIKKHPSDSLVYISDLHMLSAHTRKLFFDYIDGKEVIVANTTKIEVNGFFSLELETKKDIFDNDSILRIEDYVKYIISNYQSKFTDTELSRKLGISRKSVWEKRKRYAIEK